MRVARGMSTAFCERCGAPRNPGAAFCGGCGAPFAAAAPPLPPGTYPPGFQRLGGDAPGSGTADDVRALRSVAWAALVALIGAVVSLVVLFTGGLSLSVGASSGGSTSSLPGGSALWLELGVVVVADAFVLVEVGLFRSAFRTLAARDARFRTPASLALVLLIALVLLVPLYAWTIVLIASVLSCTGTATSIPASCISSALLGAALLLIVVAIAALVGYVGLLVGIWRLGGRFADSRFKIGAVLLIFPLLNLVGAILILLAARARRSALGAPAGGWA